MSTLTALAIILSALFVQAPTSGPEAPATAPVVECMEDEPCFEDSPLNTPPSANEQDAWLSLDTTLGQTFINPSNDELMLDYVGTVVVEPPTNHVPATHFVIPSVEQDGVWHIFEYVTVKTV